MVRNTNIAKDSQPVSTLPRFKSPQRESETCGGDLKYNNTYTKNLEKLKTSTTKTNHKLAKSDKITIGY